MEDHVGLNCFFIFGCPRSGTSVLSRMLDSHPELTVPFESHLFKMFWTQRHHYGDLDLQENQQMLLADALQTRIIRTWMPQPEFSKVMENLRYPGFGGAMDALMGSVAGDKSPRLWGEKTPGHVDYWPQINECFPDCKVISIIRDGRDVASSLAAARFGPATLEAAARHWVGYAETIEAVRRDCEPGRFFQVRYEELLADPKKVLTDICGHLAVDYSDAMLEFHKKKFVYATDRKNIENLQAPLLQKNFNKWRTELDTPQVAEIEHVAAPTLRAYGYRLSPVRLQIPAWKLKAKAMLYSPWRRLFSRARDTQGQLEFANLKWIRAKRMAQHYLYPSRPAMDRSSWR